jgi:hypothetical protein
VIYFSYQDRETVGGVHLLIIAKISYQMKFGYSVGDALSLGTAVLIFKCEFAAKIFAHPFAFWRTL